MKISMKNLIWAVVVTLVGAAIMTTGLWHSDTVNLVSVLGIVVGAQVITMGQIMAFRVGWKSRVESLKTIRNAASESLA